jgi:hypothetical protein
MVYNAVTQHSVTLHNHVLGLKPKSFVSDPVLSHYWKVTSINHDARGVPFVSTIEPVNPESWPWYGVQVRTFTLYCHLYDAYYSVCMKFSLITMPLVMLPKLQYHPEKNIAEYGVYNNQPTQMFEAIDHSATAVSFSLAMAQFWVGKLRLAVSLRKDNKNNLCHMDCVPPLFTFGIQAGRAFQQIYLIPKDYPLSTSPPAKDDRHHNDTATTTTKKRRLRKRTTRKV